MKKTVSLILALSMLLCCGCSSIQTAGQSFNPKSGNRPVDLASYLQNGISKLTKQEIKAVIPGTPEVTIIDGVETWFFQYSQRTSKLNIGFSNTTRTNNFSVEELTLTFNKNGILTAYQIKNRAGQEVDKASHMYKLGDGLFVGVVSAIVFGLINDILGRMRD